MSVFDDPSFIQNNFQALDTQTSFEKSKKIIKTTTTTQRSPDKIKRSTPPMPPIVEEEQLTRISLLTEENLKLKELIDNLLKKVSSLEQEKLMFSQGKAEADRIIMSLKEELRLHIESSSSKLRVSSGIFEEKRVKELEFLLEETRKKLIFLEEERSRGFVKEITVDEQKIKELQTKLAFMEASIEEWRTKVENLEFQLRNSKSTEKIVYVDKPVEIIKEKTVVDNRRVESLEQELYLLKEERRNLQISLEEWRTKAIIFKEIEEELAFFRRENQSLKISIEEIRSRPVKTVEKIVEVPVERFIEKRVEVPVEVVKFVEKPVEIVNEKRVRELEQRLVILSDENAKLKFTLEEWRFKLIAFEEDKLHSEKVKRSVNQDKAYYENEILRLKREIEVLNSRPTEVVEKIIEKVVEKPVPVEIYKEKVVVDDREILRLKGELALLDEELRKLTIINEELDKRVIFLEAQPPTIVEKRVEVPVEFVKEKLVVAGDRVLRELESEVVFLKAENKKLKSVVEEWKSKVADLELSLGSGRIIEKKVEIPVEIVKEKFLLDETRTQELERRFLEINEENASLKKSLEEISLKLVRYEEDRRGFEAYQMNIEHYESEILLLKKEIQRLLSLNSSKEKASQIIVERRTEPIIVEKFVESPLVSKQQISSSSLKIVNKLNEDMEENKEIVKKSFGKSSGGILKRSDILEKYQGGGSKTYEYERIIENNNPRNYVVSSHIIEKNPKEIYEYETKSYAVDRNENLKRSQRETTLNSKENQLYFDIRGGNVGENLNIRSNDYYIEKEFTNASGNFNKKSTSFAEIQKNSASLGIDYTSDNRNYNVVIREPSVHENVYLKNSQGFNADRDEIQKRSYSKQVYDIGGGFNKRDIARTLEGDQGFSRMESYSYSSFKDH